MGRQTRVGNRWARWVPSDVSDIPVAIMATTRSLDREFIGVLAQAALASQQDAAGNRPDLAQERSEGLAET